MANKRIPVAAIDLLLSEHRSERHRLLFQLQYVSKAIKELQQELKSVEGRKTHQIRTMPGMKRGPGRPRKHQLPLEAAPVKRGPGRPRKNPIAEITQVKRGPGRPRKNPGPEVTPQVKNPRGRQRKDGLPAGSLPKPKGRSRRRKVKG